MSTKDQARQIEGNVKQGATKRLVTMTVNQRYISRELTHFVGHHHSQGDQQFELLVNILKTGQLLHPPYRLTVTRNLEINSGASISNNEMFNPQVICFCDIPVEDLSIHVEKYSKFGLSFLKPFLVGKGASPVFYIAKNCLVRDMTNNDVPIPLGQYFDKMMRSYGDLRAVISRDGRRGLHDFFGFLSFHVFSYFKCFDDSRADEDRQNYYMEREWRIVGQIEFNLEDVHRVLIPREYAKRFREVVPNYYGQISFIE